MTVVYIIAPNVLNPYLGPAVVAYNTLRGFLKIETELKKQDMEVNFISISQSRTGTVEIGKAIKVIHTKRIPPLTFTGEFQASFCAMQLRMPDLVHSHNLYEVFPWIYKKVPTVYTLHGLAWREKMFSRSSYMRIYYTLSEKRLKMYYNKLAKLIAISPYVVKELLSKGFDLRKVELIENPVSDEFFKIKKKEENIILYPAVITPRKNQLTFLKAVALIKDELSDFRIVFTGSGDLKYINLLKNFIKINNLKNVKFLGRVSFNAMLDLYSKASVVALVSQEETFAMVAAEAMATGTPIIASPVGIISEALSNGKNGLIANPHDPQDIAEKLRIIIGDKRLRKKIGREAKKEAEKRWRDEVIARKLLDLYLSLLS